jgi:hypothetical protein
MTSIPTQLFRTLLELSETPADPRAEALRKAFECASVTELLLRLVNVEGTDSAGELQREINDVLLANERRS